MLSEEIVCDAQSVTCSTKCMYLYLAVANVLDSRQSILADIAAAAFFQVSLNEGLPKVCVPELRVNKHGECIGRGYPDMVSYLNNPICIRVLCYMSSI